MSCWFLAAHVPSAPNLTRLSVWPLLRTNCPQLNFFSLATCLVCWIDQTRPRCVESGETHCIYLVDLDLDFYKIYMILYINESKVRILITCRAIANGLWPLQTKKDDAEYRSVALACKFQESADEKLPRSATEHTWNEMMLFPAAKCHTRGSRSR